MIKINIIVEGETERLFVNKILSPYFKNKNIFFNKPSVIKTKINLRGKNYTGGTVRFDSLCKQINFLSQDTSSYTTTFFDYYGYKKKDKNIKKNVNELQKELKYEIKSERFIPYIQMHEFEALLFSSEKVLADKIDKSNHKKLIEIIRKYPNPEDINDSKETAPSKRLNELFNNSYKKTINGILIAQAIELEEMRKKCPRFNSWIEKLENLEPLSND